MTRARDLADGTFANDLTVDTNTLYVDSTNNRVGLGTSSPSYLIDAQTAAGNAQVQIKSGGDLAQVILHSTDTTGNSQINFADADSSNVGMLQYFHSDNHMEFTVNSSEAMRIDSNGGLLLGTTASGFDTGADNFVLGSGSENAGMTIYSGTTNTGTINFADGTSGSAIYAGGINYNHSTNTMVFYTTDGSGRMRINSTGQLCVNKTSGDGNAVGTMFSSAGSNFVRDSGTVIDVNRKGSDGRLMTFYNDANDAGSISVSGTTVSYNGGHLSRWGQTTDGQPIAGLVKGTVMTNLDQMAVWGKDGVTEDNEQLNCLAVSSVEGDANVAGVFVNYDGDDPNYPNDINLAMTGDMIIRIAQGTTVARGDLLMSAGDGTAKPQGDDIVRSKTIAKVTSTNVSHTYDDGSYCVPCVLMAC